MLREEGRAAKEDRQENDPKMSHLFLKLESKCSLLMVNVTSERSGLPAMGTKDSDSGSPFGCFISAFGELNYRNITSLRNCFNLEINTLLICRLFKSMSKSL